MEKLYKEHKIELNEYTGKFEVRINGSTKSFASLKSAQNAVDKKAIPFTPVDVLVIDHKGYDPRTYFVCEIKLTSYVERKGAWRGSGIVREFAYTGKFNDASSGTVGVNSKEFYPVSARAKIEQIIEQMNKREKAEAELSKLDDKQEKSLEKLAVSYDPRPEAN